MRKERTSRLLSTWAVDCDITSVLDMQFQQGSISCIYQTLIYPKAAVRAAIGAFGTMALMCTGRWSGLKCNCDGLHDGVCSELANNLKQAMPYRYPKHVQELASVHPRRQEHKRQNTRTSGNLKDAELRQR